MVGLGGRGFLVIGLEMGLLVLPALLPSGWGKRVRHMRNDCSMGGKSKTTSFWYGEVRIMVWGSVNSGIGQGRNNGTSTYLGLILSHLSLKTVIFCQEIAQKCLHQAKKAGKTPANPLILLAFLGPF